jgi:hypothetical protein
MRKIRGRKRKHSVALLTMVVAISLFATSPAAAISFVLRAGTPCPFAVQIEDAAQAQDGAPGQTISHAVGSGNITITNLETGATYLWFSRHTSTETFDPATKTYHETDEGRVLTFFSAGEPGPNGVVGKSGALYGMSGTREWTYTKNGVTIAFSFAGSAVDICAEID